MLKKSTSNTVKPKPARGKGVSKRRVRGRPFVKGDPRRSPGRPFVKDDPRSNRAGATKGVTRELARLLKDCLTQEGNRESVGTIDNRSVRMKNARWLTKVIWREAIKGNFQFVKEILDRILGKETQPLDVSQVFRFVFGDNGNGQEAGKE